MRNDSVFHRPNHINSVTNPRLFVDDGVEDEVVAGKSLGDGVRSQRPVAASVTPVRPEAKRIPDHLPHRHHLKTPKRGSGGKELRYDPS